MRATASTMDTGTATAAVSTTTITGTATGTGIIEAGIAITIAAEDTIATEPE